MRITVLSAGAACETKSSSLHQQTSRVLRKTEPGKRACELLTHFSEQALISVYCRNHYASFSYFFSFTRCYKSEQTTPTGTEGAYSVIQKLHGWAHNEMWMMSGIVRFVEYKHDVPIKRRSSLLQAPHVTRKTHLLALANRLFRRVLHPKCLTEPSIGETGEQLVIRPRFPNVLKEGEKKLTPTRSF